MKGAFIVKNTQLGLEIQAYYDNLMTNNVAESTLTAYKRDLKSFIQYLNDKEIPSIFKITENNIREYLDMIKAENLSDSTTARKTSVLRGLVKYMISKNILTSDILSDIESPKVEHKIKDAISDEIISKLIGNIELKTKKDLRDRAMISLMAWTGIRVSELISLNESDYSFSSKALYVDGNVEINLPSEVSEGLENYINMRDTDESDYLFPNAFGNKMTRQGFWKIIKTRAEEAGLKAEQINPNNLRQSLITKLYKDGLSTDEIQLLLGYKGKERLESIKSNLIQSGILDN